MPSARLAGADRVAVAVDATPLLGVRSGVGTFCHGMLCGLSRRDELRLSAFAVSWRRRGRLPAELPEGVPAVQRAMPARLVHAAWRRASFPPAEWFLGPVDVVHGTNFVVPPTCRAVRVVTVHDLTAVRFPELCDAPTLRFPAMVRRAVADGAWVHTPSAFVAREVVDCFGADPDRVVAVAHGLPGGCPPEDGTLCAGPQTVMPPDVGLPDGTRRVVLAIGTVEPRKDYPGLLRAFELVAGDRPDVALVIVGADGWGSAAFDAALQASPMRARVRRAGYLDDTVLASVLGASTVLAYPSRYEGFGFPPLQAMAAGVPVVATAAGAVPEVVGEAAVLVEPGDPDALAEALASVLDDEDRRVALRAAGYRRVGRFSWARCAAGLAELYRAALG